MKKKNTGPKVETQDHGEIDAAGNAGPFTTADLFTLDRLKNAFEGELPGIVSDAIDFALDAHGTQVRKYTGEAYMNHPVEVAAILKELVPEASDELTAAAILHDVAEDTDVDLFEIAEAFGQGVGRHVHGLTDVVVNKDLQNRQARTDHEAWRLSACSSEVQTAKACDLMSNMQSIVEHGEKFAPTFLQEKRYVLECMQRMDPRVRAAAQNSMNESIELLRSRGVEIRDRPE